MFSTQRTATVCCYFAWREIALCAPHPHPQPPPSTLHLHPALAGILVWRRHSEEQTTPFAFPASYLRRSCIATEAALIIYFFKLFPIFLVRWRQKGRWVWESVDEKLKFQRSVSGLEHCDVEKTGTASVLKQDANTWKVRESAIHYDKT